MKIAGDSPVYAVFGDPVAHSLSPLMHNRAFERVGFKAAYVAFRVTDIGAAVAAVRTLGIAGLSVTIPHKVGIMAYLDEIDQTAQSIGAVNTVVARGDKLVGYNTDGAGALAALEAVTSVSGKELVVVGAGGAARAIAKGVCAAGGRVTIANRSLENGRALADALECASCGLAELSTIACDILVNTTPVGMTPQVDAMPVRRRDLRPEMVVMDIVYNPWRTRLLREARKIGCITVDGISMFVNQGALQFSLWTQLPAPVSLMRQVVLKALERG
jgi:shikimate dehydrogenase